ncbi:ABC transporter permease [Halovivax cerinus]|uniref:ABC transporter permease n=1 Tax=Halovivax cerinus TaxID=1487865 RepID=A0ABD5NNZ8_9EURY|nr:ABC transporter permease [Halovivax cerinus]
MNWFRYLLRRLGQYVVVLFGVSLIIFVISRLSGDPVALMVGMDAPEELRESIRSDLGLDEPLIVQYALFMRDAIVLNFGESISMAPGEPAGQLVLSRVVPTIQLTAVAVFFAFGIGVPVGVISAIRQGEYADIGGMTFALLGQSVPSFWVGLMLILFVAVPIDFFPLAGAGSIRHLLLPGLTLSFFMMASIARLTRSNLADVLDEEFVKTARSKGISDLRVYGSHALRNAFIPVLTYAGVQIAYLFGGAVITEQIFAYPGMGRLAIQAIYSRDFPVIQAVVFFAAIMVIIVNFTIDLLYLKLDPRISYGGDR